MPFILTENTSHDETEHCSDYGAENPDEFCKICRDKYEESELDRRIEALESRQSEMAEIRGMLYDRRF